MISAARNYFKYPLLTCKPLDMKNLLLVICLFITIAICSCTKDGNNKTSNSIVGKWNVVMDSSYNTGIGASITPTIQTYIGQRGDYYNFTAQGKAYFNEGNKLSATGDYTIAGSQLKVKYDNLVIDGSTIEDASTIYTIATISAHSLTLTSSFLTPGGSSFYTLKLSK
jgi:hypothetical protein